MSFFHFGNCVALAYIPYYLVYRFSGLAEYSAFWKCIQAGGMYMVTQLIKMLILATFFPATDVQEDGIDVFGDFLKGTIDVVDLVGLHFVMSNIAGKGQLKFLVAGVGWATAELIMTRCVPLWIGARGVEFDWKYIQISIDSNISLAQNIVTAMIVWLHSRHDLQKSMYPVIVTLLGLVCYRSLVTEFVVHIFQLGAWTSLFSKAAFTMVMGFAAIELYFCQTKDSYL